MQASKLESNGNLQAVTIQDLCGTTVDKADALRLRSHDSVEAFNGDQLMPKCTFVLQALKTNQGFLIQFDEYFILEDATGPQRAANTADNITEIIPSHCNSSFFQIWEGDDVTDDVEPIVTACGTVVPDVVVESRTQFVTLRLTVHPTARVNITVLATSFDTGPCTDEVTELRCRNGRCVPMTLRCDNADNCGDNTDQLVSAPANCTLATIKGTVDFPSEILLGSLAAILVAFGLYWLFWRPGYVIWRLACCRNLARCCCHRCSCRKTTFCCHPIKCFGGSCHGNVEDEKKSQQSSKSLADDSSKEPGPLTRSDGKRGRIENVSTRGERKACIFCPCGRGGGRQDLKDSGEHDRREGGGWKGQEVNENMYDNGGDGGHVRECR
ncbi:uncharacterized protein LOC117288822 [Asterias rubens]|uniref:uncharacterized protein LOC117288822 n=1 Tax=Asterias rubens TaxID=7604 RepID=UPI001455B04D|nr:uncharacterized protein LOC117288822 [Asterias rubens]